MPWNMLIYDFAKNDTTSLFLLSFHLFIFTSCFMFMVKKGLLVSVIIRLLLIFNKCLYTLKCNGPIMM